MKVEKFSISLRPETAAAVAQRDTERSTAINRSLDRYFFLLDFSRRKLAELLSDGEIGLILDALNGTAHYEPFSIQLVPHSIADSLEDGYAEKWEVNGPALVEKLEALDMLDKFALVDAVERWWHRVERGEQPYHGEALRPQKRKSE